MVRPVWPAERLSEDDVANYIEEAWHDRLCYVDGYPYDLDDLSYCEDCGLFFVDPLYLTEMYGSLLCGPCLVGALEDVRFQYELETQGRFVRR